MRGRKRPPEQTQVKASRLGLVFKEANPFPVLTFREFNLSASAAFKLAESPFLVSPADHIPA